MVKNTTGGSKTKGQARKFVNSKPSNSLRTSTNELEVYAQVIKLLGGSMCHINDNTGKVMLCHIRGKFRGRSKRDNFIEAGTWVLVGLREWSVGQENSRGKLEECDILEVYNDADKNRLINTVTNFNWNPFITYNKKTNMSSLKEDEETSFEFSDEKTEDYKMLLEAQLKESSSGKTTIIALGEDEIDIDDI
jgi:translation initiation factor IF-1